MATAELSKQRRPGGHRTSNTSLRALMNHVHSGEHTANFPSPVLVCRWIIAGYAPASGGHWTGLRSLIVRRWAAQPSVEQTALFFSPPSFTPDASASRRKHSRRIRPITAKCSNSRLHEVDTRSGGERCDGPAEAKAPLDPADFSRPQCRMH
jgi:hypothetical protein